MTMFGCVYGFTRPLGLIMTFENALPVTLIEGNLFTFFHTTECRNTEVHTCIGVTQTVSVSLNTKQQGHLDFCVGQGLA